VGDPDRGIDYHQCGGWIYNILPYIESRSLYDLGMGVSATAKFTYNDQRVQTAVANFNCPTRRRVQLYAFKSTASGGTGCPPANYDSVAMVARSDYAANGGDKNTRPSLIGSGVWGNSYCGNTADCGPPPWPTEQTLLAGVQIVQAYQPTGLVYALSQVKMAQVTDGAANTYLAGEKYLTPDHYDDGKDQGDNENLFIGDNPDITRWVALSGANATYFTPPRQDTPGSNASDQYDYYRFGSAHPSTFSMVFCDGATRSINFTIDPNLHRLLGCRNDGQITNLSSLGM
jgi:hypothetical protein